jgi:hypothetical protein
MSIIATGNGLKSKNVRAIVISVAPLLAVGAGQVHSENTGRARVV